MDITTIFQEHWWVIVLFFADEALLALIFGVMALEYLGLTPPQRWFKWLRKKKR